MAVIYYIRYNSDNFETTIIKVKEHEENGVMTVTKRSIEEGLNIMGLESYAQFVQYIEQHEPILNWTDKVGDTWNGIINELIGDNRSGIDLKIYFDGEQGIYDIFKDLCIVQNQRRKYPIQKLNVILKRVAIEVEGNVEEIEETTETFSDEEIQIECSNDGVEESADVQEETEGGMEDYYISSILHIKEDEKVVIKNKNVIISSYVNCEGCLEFINCTLTYNDISKSNEIVLGKDAQLKITDSSIACKGYGEKFFISGETCEVIVFENCTFLDCSQFLNIRIVKHLFLRDCELRNCFDGFVCVSVNDESCVRIEGNSVLQEELAFFYEEKVKKAFSNYGSVISVNQYGYKVDCKSIDVQVYNNLFAESPDFIKSELKENSWHRLKLLYVDSDIADVKNCTFIGLQGGHKNILDFRLHFQTMLWLCEYT